MLGKMVKEHATKQQIQKEMQEKKKNEAIVAAHIFSNAVVEHLNKSVSHAYNNQKKIDVESKRMQNFAVSLTKFADGWIGLIDSFNATLKQVGDVESWANVIDNDITIIANTLKEVSNERMKKTSKLNDKVVD